MTDDQLQQTVDLKAKVRKLEAELLIWKEMWSLDVYGDKDKWKEIESP